MLEHDRAFSVLIATTTICLSVMDNMSENDCFLAEVIYLVELKATNVRNEVSSAYNANKNVNRTKLVPVWPYLRIAAAEHKTLLLWTIFLPRYKLLHLSARSISLGHIFVFTDTNQVYKGEVMEFQSWAKQIERTKNTCCNTITKTYKTTSLGNMYQSASIYIWNILRRPTRMQ